MSKFDDAYLRMQQFGAAMLGRLDDSKRHIDEIRQGRTLLPDNCPSRASGIQTFYLDGVQKDLDEVNAAMKEAVAEIWKERDDK